MLLHRKKGRFSAKWKHFRYETVNDCQLCLSRLSCILVYLQIFVKNRALKKMVKSCILCVGTDIQVFPFSLLWKVDNKVLFNPKKIYKNKSYIKIILQNIEMKNRVKNHEEKVINFIHYVYKVFIYVKYKIEYSIWINNIIKIYAIRLTTRYH